MASLVKILLFFVFVLAPATVWSQGKEPLQVDEFGPLSSEEIQARLDYAMVQLQNDPNTRLQFVFNRGEKDSLGSPYRLYGRMKTYLLYRKFDTNRVFASFCEPKAEMFGQLWLLHANGQEQQCSPENIVITNTTLFDTAQSATERGLNFGCCIVDSFGPAAANESLRAFADLLERYPESRAYVFAYGGTNVYWTLDSRNRERTIRNLDTPAEISDLLRNARQILTRNGIRASRVITRNAGYRDSVAQLELWIVPRAGAIPKMSPNYTKKGQQSNEKR